MIILMFRDRAVMPRDMRGLHIVALYVVCVWAHIVD